MFDNKYKYSDIEGIHIELTSKCNLKCPQCARIHNGEIIETLPLSNLPLDKLKKIFDEMGSQIKYVHLCGNYGDIVSYPHAHAALDLIWDSGVEYIKVYSNGSSRSVGWWEEMGKRLSGNNGQMVFSIDGLEDTNHLYRVGSKWKKIMENATAFINAGGNAVWEWLPFKHNEHQVDEAVALSKRMGFKEIIIKSNPRFSPLNNGAHHLLEPSDLYVHKGIQNQEGRTRTMYPIECKYKKRKMIFVDFEGNILPCCWHGNRYKGNSRGINDFQQIMNGYEGNVFNLCEHSVEEVLDNDWYSKDMEYTIKILDTCRKHCTMGSKMSNKDNRIVYTHEKIYDPEPWE